MCLFFNNFLEVSRILWVWGNDHNIGRLNFGIFTDRNIPKNVRYDISEVPMGNYENENARSSPSEETSSDRGSFSPIFPWKMSLARMEPFIRISQHPIGTPEEDI